MSRRKSEEASEPKIFGLGWSEFGKLIIGFGGLFIAFNEFILKNRSEETERFKNSQSFLLKTADSNITNSLVNTIKNARKPVSPEDDHLQFLVEATPVHEFLVGWSACISGNLCEQNVTVTTFCYRLVGYEELAIQLFRKIEIPYNRNERNRQYHKMLDKCESMGIIVKNT
jgi:hypothetical protein